MALIDTSFHHIERQHAGYTSKAEAGDYGIDRHQLSSY